MKQCPDCKGERMLTIDYDDNDEAIYTNCETCDGLGLLEIPSRIYLQVMDEDGELLTEPTWCEDQITDSDLVYVIDSANGVGARTGHLIEDECTCVIGGGEPGPHHKMSCPWYDDSGEY